MRFSLAILSVLASTAVANPASRDVARRDTTADTIKFAMEAADCDVGKCAGIIAAALCLLGCRKTPTLSCISGCISGGADSVSYSFSFSSASPTSLHYLLAILTSSSLWFHERINRSEQNGFNSLNFFLDLFNEAMPNIY